jgi:hypothetical protein
MEARPERQAQQWRSNGRGGLMFNSFIHRALS